MKPHRKICLALILSFLLPLLPRAQSSPALPDYLQIELKRLEETWHILDLYAQQIWPGWTAYREVPFHFKYPNGVRMLVGHPDPMDGYQPVPGLLVGGKQVHLNRQQEIPLPMKLPLSSDGGGPIPLGKVNHVLSVDLHSAESLPPEPDAAGTRQGDPPPLWLPAEEQILTNIHELFHCFQQGKFQYRYGNLRFNTDTNYALFSEIEGIALEKAFFEPDAATAKAYLLDFLAARFLKRQSMVELEQNQESEDDLGEGTAIYAEALVLNLMAKGYRPGISQMDDPSFRNFADHKKLLAEKCRRLVQDRERTMEAKRHCYHFGAFQALLLSRFFPGWQEEAAGQGKFMDGLLASRLQAPAWQTEQARQRLEKSYPVTSIQARHQAVIQERDQALASLLARQGRVFIINFKPAREYLNIKGRGKQYQIGLMNIFPGGIEEIRLRDVLFTGQPSPVLHDQYYYVKWVDTKAAAGEKGYSVTCTRQEGPDVYYGAVVTTAGFTLRAPKVKIRESAGRVKITILEKTGAAKNRTGSGINTNPEAG